MLIIICLILGVVVLSREFEPEGFLDWFMVLFLGPLLGGVIAFVLMFICWCVIPSHELKTGKSDLVSLNDAAGVKGSFFLGTGSVSSDLTYYYYQRETNGGFTGQSQTAKDAIVYQDEQNYPHVEHWGRAWDWGWIGFFVPAGPCVRDQCHDLHVPQDSILPGFKLDAQSN